MKSYPMTGAWIRSRRGGQVPYANARVWGTGINPVHAFRGDTSRPDNAKLNANQIDQVPAGFAVSQDFIGGPPEWGYQAEDIAGLDVFAPEAITGIPFTNQGWPEWEGGIQTGQSTPVNRADIPRYASRPLGQSRRYYNMLRSVRGGAHDNDRWVSNQIPTETVSEGWVNKPATGMDEGTSADDYVMPSAVSQYERNTSMQQRFRSLDNERALERGADEPRTSIPSRVVPMKLKEYSQGERTYDMFPYQADVIPRPFRYRQFGSGPEEYMQVNDQHPRTAIQRTPPPDPSLGTPDTEMGAGHGYTDEDGGWY